MNQPEKNQAEPQKMTGHQCDYAYPTQEQAMDAAASLYRCVTGECDSDFACKAHCGYTVIGFGLSFMEHDHDHEPQPMGAEDCPDPDNCDDEAVAKVLEPVVQMQNQNKGQAEMRAIPWTLIVQVILQWLANRNR